MTHALIFDFDGTIVDTESPTHHSTAEIWRAHGLELDFEWWVQGLGSHRKDAWIHELERLTGGPIDRVQLMEDRRRIKDQITDAQPVLPGVSELLAAAVDRGLPLAVGSSSEHEWVDRHLDRVGLMHRFDHVVCRDDVGGRAKPEPDVFLRAVELLGAHPDDVVVIEDSHNGVLAARAAGLRSVVVPNPLVGHLDFPEATMRLDTLDAHTPHDLLDLLFG
ncbi:MAG: HAD-IA family hydrolase [Actinomycetota bacterium]|jgi:putative hydrolase of the HAD superfamily|nr:HAD-IA family hydrolase [Actinomycetota bacterium]